MFTTQVALGLGLGRPGDGAGDRVAGAGDLVAGAGLADLLCRPWGWLAAGTGPFETTRLTLEPFETCVPYDGFVEITSFFATDADGA